MRLILDVLLHPSLADERFEIIVSLAVVIAAAAAFVTIGMVEGVVAFQFGRAHKRELLSYLVLGTLFACLWSLPGHL
jgi:regulator of protease activity HflC (stomatin/prohibitin superfamily)